MHRRREKHTAVSAPARLPNTHENVKSSTVTTSTPITGDMAYCAPMRRAVSTAMQAVSFAGEGLFLFNFSMTSSLFKNL